MATSHRARDGCCSMSVIISVSPWKPCITGVLDTSRRDSEPRGIVCTPICRHVPARTDQCSSRTR
jgi:hypothetical protein